MACYENSFTMDIGLLAEVSRELKDRICADTFRKLQKKTDRELFHVNSEVDRVLRNESYIKSRLYPLIDVLQENRGRSMKIKSILWNQKEFLPASRKMNKYLDKCRLKKSVGTKHVNEKCLLRESEAAEHLANHFSSPIGRDYIHIDTNKSYPMNTMIQSAPPRMTSDKLLTAKLITDRNLNTLRSFKSNTSEMFLSENRQSNYERVIEKARVHAHFTTQWRPEPDPLSWKKIQFTNIDSEVRSRSRNRFCGAFNATSFQLIYAH
uniref:Uncharacterized protein n=1 Tax=Trichobilharzia regenti TaxID=157069 RepID=A0AA85JG32_TRIRE|nr:unnamed protein product [Trichobilharzia regenti]